MASVVLGTLAGAPSQAWAQAEGSVTSTPAPAAPEPAIDYDLLKSVLEEELRRELKKDIETDLRKQLKDEIREEILNELEDARGADIEPAPAPIQDDAWAEEEWRWEEPVRPELDLIELDGYFRFRYDWFADLDLDTYYVRGTDLREGESLADARARQIVQGPFAPGFSPPTPLCETDVVDRGMDAGAGGDARAPANSCANRPGDNNTLGGANIRFRLEPTLNVYEDIKVKAQIDVFDNLVLGSTPDGPFSPLSPLAALSQTQISPSAGLNTVWRDSIRVKRVWAEVMTPLGQLSFGRMPNHFGMGVSSNDGNGIDMDFGDTVDRIMFAATIGDFLVVPAFDWAASGPTSANLLSPQGQPFDRDQADDVDQYVLTITKVDSPEVRDRKLANDEFVIDLGAQLMLRIQDLDGQQVNANGNVNNQATTSSVLDRDAQIFMYTAWAEFRYRKFVLSAEYSGVVGSIGEVAPAGDFDTGTGQSVDLNQHGGALRGSYKLLNDALTIELLVLAASGDGAPGWGVFPFGTVPNPQNQNGAGTQNGRWESNQGQDGEITNYRFDPDFIVDLIFWRQLVGLVTDALVIRPSVEYNLTEQLGGRLDIIYSRAWFGSSTPSGSFLDEGTRSLGGPDENLGLEADATLFYRSEQGFSAQLQYGIFFPMDGLDRQVFVDSNDPRFDPQDLATFDNQPVARLDSTIAHTIQLLLAVTF